MPKYCANLDFMFSEFPLLERLAAAAAEGFEAVELLSPYDGNAHEFSEALFRHQLELVLITSPPPNFTGGPRGFAAVPGLESRFQYDFRRTLRYAKSFKCRKINLISGVTEADAAYDTMIRNVTWAIAQDSDFHLTIEPLNAADIEGYFLSSFDLTERIINEVNSPALSLQLDLYHALRMGEDPFDLYTRFSTTISHIQVAHPEDRSEPKGSKFNFKDFFKMLDKEGYSGWVSGEYTPKSSTLEGLNWRV